MNSNLNDLFVNHAEWLKSEGESGNQLVLESINSEKLSDKQLQLLTDSILFGCIFNDAKLNNIDFYHTEMYSCNFSGVWFNQVQFIKSEVNETEFSEANFESTNFTKAEFFDCDFARCEFKNTSFISAGIWNTLFDECSFINIDFESIYIENVIFSHPQFINPKNLDKATKIVLNIGTFEKPVLLNYEESVKWIEAHSK